ncbi:MAG: RNA 2',3'-cyclic phosphodiesterase [Candidatus Omnitrophica bacterium]|nr:RNA 2',3'-cyclic phosphodiesterase [Candidatus Omnitrophota bacterium]
MRAFIAIPIPEQTKKHLLLLQEKLKGYGADVKWVQTDNIHLTLKFLGEVDEDNLSKVYRAIENAVKETCAFSADIASLGAFPKIDYPKVIWVGIRQGEKETKEIAGLLEEEIEKTGIPKEKREFESHITIGRVRSLKNLKDLSTRLNEFTDYFEGTDMNFMVSKIVLFKSTLSPKGPTYEAIKEVNLKTH